MTVTIPILLFVPTAFLACLGGVFVALVFAEHSALVRGVPGPSEWLIDLGNRWRK